MSDNNKCIFRGRLTRDPQTRQTKNTTVTQVSIAVNDVIKTAGGKEIEKTAYVDGVCWDTGGRLLAAKFKQGSQIEIEAEFETTSYINSEEKKIYKNQFRVGRFWAIDAEGNKVQVNAETQAPSKQEEREPVGVGADDDEAPF